jgi:hypothetical protein
MKISIRSRFVAICYEPMLPIDLWSAAMAAHSLSSKKLYHFLPEPSSLSYPLGLVIVQTRTVLPLMQNRATISAREYALVDL